MLRYINKKNNDLSTSLLYFSGILFLLIAFIFGFFRITFFPFEIKEDYKITPNLKISKLICIDHEGFLADMLFIQ
ncbi:MAG: hypothetical protein KAR45_19830, partial [Desulfobacteraceae bacterium]|nr:hypothetical protein [Desulfobacteraceae bacterium]